MKRIDSLKNRSICSLVQIFELCAFFWISDTKTRYEARQGRIEGGFSRGVLKFLTDNFPTSNSEFLADDFSTPNSKFFVLHSKNFLNRPILGKTSAESSSVGPAWENQVQLGQSDLIFPTFPNSWKSPSPITPFSSSLNLRNYESTTTNLQEGSNFQDGKWNSKVQISKFLLFFGCSQNWFFFKPISTAESEISSPN